ncbi:MAG TPA: ATP-binding protein [Anaerolineaceae bacterium]|nr:ATP-binding protein [Anaerolineaceae bacterium]HQP61500.1 ATP-binding protein [Anaerolineaceae bacterium]
MKVEPSPLPPIEFDHVYLISRIIGQAGNWKSALDQILSQVRKVFIFDNVAVYLLDTTRRTLDVGYAKAAGRGHSREADVAWGENLSSQVMLKRSTILQEPPDDPAMDRLERPFILGVPLIANQQILGTIIFIRFGSPPFTPTQTQFAEYLGQQIALLIAVQQRETELSTVESLRQTLRIQGDFISTLSHEIRNPLGFIKGYTTTLLRTDKQWDADTQQEFLKIIDQETDRLQELIENLLDSARLETGLIVMNFQPVRVEAVLNDIITRSRLHHPGLEILLQINPPVPPIIADARRLTQVIENLLNNIEKYAEGSPAIITVHHQDSQVFIDVADKGPGIPEKYLELIFERFFRNPEREKQVYGSGLGLFICRQIIHAHHGSINVESTPGEGTTFTIALPINQPQNGMMMG